MARAAAAPPAQSFSAMEVIFQSDRWDAFGWLRLAALPCAALCVWAFIALWTADTIAAPSTVRQRAASPVVDEDNRLAAPYAVEAALSPTGRRVHSSDIVR